MALSKKDFNIFLGVLALLLISQVAKAQGPTQPEAMQFEPVDVTDVVNLATGDFVYTIPLMSVPGPEGDYPIVLSYHSGIGPNQPATWVGLGWTLNPGAINRTLSGYPDDYRGDIVKTHYEATSKSSWGINIGAGLGPVGINMNYDHYSGMVGVNVMVNILGGIDALGLGGGAFANSPFDVGVTAGTSGVSANASLGSSKKLGGSNLFASAGISAGTNGSVGISGGVSRSMYGGGKKGNSLSLISAGSSLSSSGLGASFSVGGTGFSSITQSSGGSFKQSGFSAKIPLPGRAWVSFGYSKWKWTLDETFVERSYGTLYKGVGNSNTKRERQKQGEYLMPSKDAFNVTAQGLGGAFVSVDNYAYVIEDGFENDEKGTIKRVWGNETYTANTATQFRFLDDQGYNFVDQSGGIFGNEYTQLDQNEYSGKKITPLFTSSGRIRGFVVVQTDGMVYEFMQPVQNLYQYSETNANDGSGYKNWNSLNGAYATSWLLTAVKGPDYVDRDMISGVSDGDWGYWVKFTHQISSAPQPWRAPYSGNNVVGNEDADQFSFGVREEYYLKSIETKTHRAEFSSQDSKNGQPPNVSLTSIGDLTNPRARSDDFTFNFKGNFTWIDEAILLNSSLNSSTFISVIDYNDIVGNNQPCDPEDPNCDETSQSENELEEGTPYDGDPVFDCNNTSVLRSFNRTQITSMTYDPLLDETIITVPNGTPCTEYYESQARLHTLPFIETSTKRTKKLNRVELINKFENNSFKAIELTYDYRLRPNTNGSTAVPSDGASDGALTLIEVKFLGLNDTPVSPPYRFEYGTGELNPDYHVDDIDVWGKYRFSANALDRGPKKRATPQEKGKADLVAAWSMNRIITPTGSELEIEYESDDYFFVNGVPNLKSAIDLDVTPWSVNDTTLTISSSFPSTVFTGEQTLFLMEKTESGVYEENINGDIKISTIDEIDYFMHPLEVESITSSGVVNLKTPIEIEHFSTAEIINPHVPPGETVTVYERVDHSYELIFVPFETYGGGLRVKSVTTRDGTTQLKNLYQYKDGNFSSGTTPSLVNPNEESTGSVYIKPDRYREAYLNHGLAFDRPSPSIIYSKVQVLNVDTDNKPVSGMTEYEFFTSKEHTYDVTKNLYTRTITIKNRSGIYGKPKATTVYEQFENNEGSTLFRPIVHSEQFYAFSDELNSKANTYSAENTTESGFLGITQQKHVSNDEYENGTFRHMQFDVLYLNVFDIGSISRKYFYDTDTDESPSSSLSSRSRTIGFDMHTGAPLITASQTTETNKVAIQKITPAWWKYSAMGTKNMLTQVFQETSYLASGIDISNDVQLKGFTPQNSTSDIIASTITTWDDTWDGGISNGVWRKNDTYSYIPSFVYSEFPTNKLQISSNSYDQVTASFPWKMTSNIVSYDGFGHAIETVNEDGTFQTVVYDSQNESLVLAVASNAKANEVIYSNFESGSGTTSGYARTGERSRNQYGGTLLTAPSSTPIHGGKWKVGIWYKTSGNPIYLEPTNSAEVQYPYNQGQWNFVSLLLDPGESLDLRESAWFDDITIIPEYASLSYFAYDPLTWKVTAMTGPDHRTNFFEYDDAGRLKSTLDQDKNITQLHEYGYGQEFYITPDNTRPVLVPNIGVEVTFEAKHITNQTLSSYKWDFGEGIGQITSQNSASYTFTKEGVYPISVSYKRGNKDLRTVKLIEVLGPVSGTLTSNVQLINYIEPTNTEDFLDFLPPEIDFNGNNIYYQITAQVEAKGGVKPYSYSWEKKVGSGSWEALSSTSNNVVFTAEKMEDQLSLGITIRCTITDFDSNDVIVTEDVVTIIQE